MPPPFDDNSDAFLDMLPSYRGLYGNMAEPRNVPDLNFGQLGGLGQYFNNPLAVLGLQQGINWAFGQAGLMPSQFAPGRNLYDQYEDKAYWQSRMAAVTSAADADRATYTQMLRGIARMRGTPWGLEQQRAAGVIAGDVSMMAPILSQIMPETFDALHGTRGSATVMAQFLHRGGRFAVDPVTGRAGLGAETVGAMSREIQSRFFAPGMDLSEWRGLGMGQAGALYEALQNRGTVGPSIGLLPRADQVTRVAASPEGRAAFVRMLAEQQPEEFARLRARAEEAGPGFAPDVRALPPARQVAELLRDRAAAPPLLDAVRRGDAGLAERVAPGGAVDVRRLADPQLLAAVVQAVQANMPREQLQQLAEQRARAAGTAGLPPAEQVRRVAGVDEAGRRGLEILQRADPAAYNRLVDEFDRDRPAARRIAALTPDRQAEILARDRPAAERALDLVRRREPAQFERLRDVADRARPGGALAGLGLDEQVRRIAETENVTERAIRDMQQAQPGRFEALLRQFDADSVSRRLRDMAGAVGAMREIFGDQGRPNAPMTELLEGINALTQGGMATMNPADLERMVRTTNVLSRQTGMGMNAMMGLTAQGAATADQLGLDRVFAVQATQGAAAFGAAFAQAGRGDLPAWGRADRDRLTLMDQQLRLRAAQSELANRLGATMRVVEAREDAGLAVTPGLRALSEAVRAGREDFAPDPGRPDRRFSVMMGEAEWRGFMEQQGVPAGTALQMLRAREENQRPIAQFGIANTVRGLQRHDVRQFVSASFRQAAQDALIGAGVDQDRAARLSEQIGGAQARALVDMPAERRVDRRTRNAVLGDVAMEALRDAGLDPGVVARFRDSTQAETGWGNLARAVATSPAFAGFRTPQALLDANSPQVMAAQRAVMERADVTVAMQTAVGGLGQAGPLRRLMDMIQDPPPDLATAVGQAFGGVRPEEVRRRVMATRLDDPGRIAGESAQGRLAVAMEEFLGTVSRFERVGRDPNMTPERRVAEMRILQQRAEALRVGGPAATREIRRELERVGVLRPGDDLAPVLERVSADAAAFPQVDAETRRRITALRAVGGGLDPEAIRRESTAILARSSLAPEQLGRALAGDLRMPEADRDRLRALQGMGIDAAAAQAGVAVGAEVGVREVEDVRHQGRLLAEDLGDLAAPRMPPAGSAEAAEAKRHAENVIGRGERTVDALLGNVESVRAMGAGGFALARDVRERQKEMQRIAQELGIPAAAVLTGGSRKDPRVREFLRLHGEVQAKLGDVSVRLTEGPGRFGTATAEELTEYEAYRVEETRGDDERNRAAVDRVLGADVTAAPAEAGQRQEVAGLLGTGVEAESRRRMLDRAVIARGRLQELGRAHGLDLAGLRGELARPTGALTPEERTRATEAIGRAGALGEGVGIENLRQFLETTRPRHAGEEPGQTREIRLSGRLDLRNGQVDARGEPITPFGATPAMS